MISTVIVYAVEILLSLKHTLLEQFIEDGTEISFPVRNQRLGFFCCLFPTSPPDMQPLFPPFHDFSFRLFALHLYG